MTIFDSICRPAIRRKKTKFKEVEGVHSLNVLGHNAQGVAYNYMKTHLKNLEEQFRWGVILGVEFLVGDANNVSYVSEDIDGHRYFNAPSIGGSPRLPAIILHANLAAHVSNWERLEEGDRITLFPFCF